MKPIHYTIIGLDARYSIAGTPSISSWGAYCEGKLISIHASKEAAKEAVRGEYQFNEQNSGEYIMNTTNTLPAWSIRQMYATMQNDLLACNNNFERSMVKAIAGKELREAAIEWAKTRKLTPGEVAIAQEFGYKGN